MDPTQGHKASLRDAERLAAVRRTGLLDGAPEPALDRLSRVACRTLGCSSAIVCLVADDRQVFAGQHGLPESVPGTRDRLSSGPRPNFRSRGTSKS